MRVNVDICALTDGRFAQLGMLLGCPRAFALDYGRGRMEHVWAYCTNQARPVLEAWEIENILGEGAAAHVVAARLAEETPDGYRIKGAKGRIEWLEKKRGVFQANKQSAIVSESTKSLDVCTRYLSSDIKEQEQEDLSSSPLLALTPARDPDGSHVRARTAWAESVYAHYPRKKGKGKGIAALAKKLKQPEDRDRALVAVKNFAAQMAKECREIDHILYFSSWVSELDDWVSPEPDMQMPARASPRNGYPTTIDTSGLPDFSAYED